MKPLFFRKCFFTAILLGVLGVLGGFPAMAASWEHGLAVRHFFEGQRWPTAWQAFQPEFQRDSATLQELVRLWIERKHAGMTWKLEIEADGLARSSPLSGKNAIGGWTDRAPGQSRLTFWNWSKRHVDGRRGEFATAVERADLAWSWGRLDFDAGRQPISLGTSHFISLLDVLAPFHPGYLDSSYKPGIDAIRVRTGFGISGEAELIAVPGGGVSRGALLGRFRNTVRGFDLELIGGRFREQRMIGLGFEGERRKVNWWGECALFEHRSRAFSAITGFEKEIGRNLRLGGGFLHQDFGTSHARELPDVYDDSPYLEGWAFLGGRSYGLLNLRKEFTPLVTGHLNGVRNLADGSTLWQPKVTWNTGDNADITLFAWLPTGDGPSLAVPPMPYGHPLKIQTEFGLFPSGLGILARRFF